MPSLSSYAMAHGPWVWVHFNEQKLSFICETGKPILGSISECDTDTGNAIFIEVLVYVCLSRALSYGNDKRAVRAGVVIRRMSDVNHILEFLYSQSTWHMPIEENLING